MNMANKFNNYFVDSSKDIRDLIDNMQYINNINESNIIFKFKPISLQNPYKIVKQLKNKSDFNKINTKMILDNWNVIGPNIMKIINKLLINGVFPNTWKDAIVTPIEKIPNTRTCEEFRPINTLKTFEKY